MPAPPTDSLTGARNLTALAERFPPGATPTIAIWVDVDGLIWLNDAAGHEAGDAALAAIGRWLLEEAAPAGLEVYRVAGDEFVLVRADLSLAEAYVLADHLVARAPALGLRLAADGRDVLTVSALVFLADARLASDRRAVCEALAHAIYAAGQAAGRRYQRRGVQIGPL